MRGRFLAALLAALVSMTPAAAATAEADGEMEIAAGGAVLIEAHGDRLIYEKDGDKRLPMASTTKIMTALIALERGNPTDMVQVPPEAAGVEGSSMYLSAGERISLNDLLYGLMLTSGNDAAVAIAVHLGGSVEGFAELMNRRAEELGCENTHFVTPNGLHHKEHYTSARDLARIASACMKLPAFSKIAGTTYHETETGDHARVLKNKNRLLWQYDGGCGVKTGYTKAAGKCLVFAAQRGETLLIGTALNAPDMWGASVTLLDYGFEQMAARRFVSAHGKVADISVTAGRKRALAVCPKEDILYGMKLDGSDEAELRMSLPETVEAPVRKDQVLGRLTLYVNGRPVAETELLSMEAAARRIFADDIGAVLERFTA